MINEEEILLKCLVYLRSELGTPPTKMTRCILPCLDNALIYLTDDFCIDALKVVILPIAYIVTPC